MSDEQPTRSSRRPRRRLFGSVSGGIVAAATAAGTLMAGLAAMLAIWLPTAGDATPGNAGEGEAGSTSMTTATSFASLSNAVADSGSSELPGGGAYADYEEVGFPSLSVEVPTAWFAHEKGSWLASAGSEPGPYVAASAGPIDDLYGDAATAGVFIGLSDAPVAVSEELHSSDEWRASLCDPTPTVGDLHVGPLSGGFQIWRRCGDASYMMLDVAARDRVGGALVVLVAKIVDKRDIEAVRTVLETLTIELDSIRDNEQLKPGFEGVP